MELTLHRKIALTVTLLAGICMALGLLLIGARHFLFYEAPTEKVRESENAIKKAITLHPVFSERVLTNDVPQCEKHWKDQVPKDGWGKSLQIKILNTSPFEYKIWTITPWPEDNVIEYDSRYPEKGIQKYRF